MLVLTCAFGLDLNLFVSPFNSVYNILLLFSQVLLNCLYYNHGIKENEMLYFWYAIIYTPIYLGWWRRCIRLNYTARSAGHYTNITATNRTNCNGKLPFNVQVYNFQLWILDLRIQWKILVKLSLQVKCIAWRGTWMKE